MREATAADIEGVVATYNDVIANSRTMNTAARVSPPSADAGNAASLRLHERLGFTAAGGLRQVGYEFDRWLDLVFLQRTL